MLRQAACLRGAACRLRTISISFSIDARSYNTKGASKYKSNYERQIVLYASEVPVICGANPFREISDVFLGVWKRTDKKYVAALESDLAPSIPETIEEKVERVVEEQPAVQAVLDEVSETVADVQAKKKVVRQQIEAMTTLSPAEKEDVTQALHSTLQTQFGMAQEVHAIGHYETQTQTTVEQRNIKFWSKQVGRVRCGDGGYRNVLVGGRIDGISGETVIEVKNRIRAFKDPLPPYDVMQLQTYLYLLDSSQGEIVEHLKNKKDTSKTTAITWDPAMWDERVLPYLARFSYTLDRFMDSPPQIHELFLTHDTKKRKEMIRAYWMDSPNQLEG
ncbi:Aste57867_23042 [Aphanomyces stellatus]|uniref:Aste57867_23042 protein n=1 Tax=Aphanomyces stellatus TaxID=120398 RepID=A0A485LRB6_9STRA|nr:hypothetical protein As57867_022971 [Aphanomyces stellatus]VFT99690.1 Aste57867_23042 [Aphanomyces stellatus]